jgi:hypothetical protein
VRRARGGGRVRVLYLSGHYSDRIATVHPKLGFIVTPATSYRIPDGVVWAADNGCFSRPETFRLGRYLEWLGNREHQARWCLFATAPDRFGDAEATLDLFAETGPAVRAAGYPVALVGQDGLEALPVPWDDFDCLFIGGSTRWKLSEAAWQLGQEAKRRGKWVHVGRVNGVSRLRAAKAAGFDSADGTKLAFGPDVNLPLVLGWLDAVNGQPALLEAVS